MIVAILALLILAVQPVQAEEMEPLNPASELASKLKALENSFELRATIGHPRKEGETTVLGWYEGELDDLVKARNALLKSEGCFLRGYWMTDGPFTTPRIDRDYRCRKDHPPK